MTATLLTMPQTSYPILFCATKKKRSGGLKEMRQVGIPFLRKHGDTWHWEPSAAARRLGFKNVACGKDDARALEIGARLWRQYSDARDAAAARYEGSFRHLRDIYKETREWKRLAEKSKKDYGRYIERVIVPRWGILAVEAVDAEVAAVLHESMAKTPYAANQCIKVLGAMFRCALAKPSEFPGMAGRKNPCDEVSLFGVKEGVKQRERLWTSEEIAAFAKAAGPETRMAQLLLLYTGQRLSDVLAMRDTDYKAENGDRWLHVTQEKTGKRLWIYCHQELWPPLEAHIARHRERRPIIGVPLIQNTKGASFNQRVFVNRWDKVAVRAGIVILGERAGKRGPRARRSRDNPTRHDLRRNATTYLAEAGCTDDQISSITGLSRSMVQKQVYNVRTKAHAKAAIKKLEEYRR